MTGANPPELLGGRVLLRGFRSTDAEDRRRYGINAELARMVGESVDMDSAMTAEMAERWYQRLMADAGPHHWAIQFEGRFIGTSRLHSFVPDDRRASYAIGIVDPDCIGLNLGQEVTRVVATHAFQNLGLHRLAVRVLAYNERAIHCYESCGFVVEGRERQSAWVNGEWHDDVIMGLLADDNPAL